MFVHETAQDNHGLVSRLGLEADSLIPQSLPVLIGDLGMVSATFASAVSIK
jgi:hypothetical protein